MSSRLPLLWICTLLVAGRAIAAESPETARRRVLDALRKSGVSVTVVTSAPGRSAVLVLAGRFSDEQMALLKNLPDLESLEVASTQVTDAGLLHLKALKRLRKLDVRGTRVSDGGLAHLAGLVGLEWLDLGWANERVTDAGLVHLRGLRNLQVLKLRGTRVGNRGLSQLRGLTRLQELDLGRTAITDAGLMQLRGLPELAVLDLFDTAVTGATLTDLKDLKELTTLRLRRTRVTDAGLAGLRTLTGLRELDLMQTSIGDAAMVHLKGLTELERLNLYMTGVGDAGLAHLAALTKLERLNLYKTKVSDASLAYLKRLPQLRWLDLYETAITAAGVEELKQARPALQIMVSKKIADAVVLRRKRLLFRERYRRKAEALRNKGQRAEAIAAREKALALERVVFGKVHEAVAESLRWLADLHEQAEQFASARAARQEVLALETQLHGPGHYTVTNARLKLADVGILERLSKADREQLWKAHALAKLAGAGGGTPRARSLAISLMCSALETRRKLLGEDHADTAAALSALGVLWQEEGDWAQALPCFERAQAIRRKVLGDHPLTADALNNLALLYQDKGDVRTARQFAESYLALIGKLFGAEDRRTATALNNLGAVLQQQGDRTAARLYFERALAVRLQLGGENHPDSAESLNNLGTLLYQLGDLPPARAYFERALAVYRRLRGDDHPSACVVRNNLGGVLQEQGNYAAARLYLEQALAGTRKSRGEDHPDTARALQNLGVVIYLQGDFAAARPLLERALAINRKTLGEDHMETTATLSNLGLVLAEQGEEGAGVYLKQALDSRRKVYGAHPDNARLLSNLGAWMHSRGNNTEARTYCEQAFVEQLRVTRQVVEVAAEAEALAHVAGTRYHRDALLSLLWRRPQETAEQAYQAVWDSRALVTRALAARRPPPDADGAVRDLWERLRVKRAELAKLTLAVVPPAKASDRQQRLIELTQDKEKLERQLAKASSAFRRQQQLQRVGFAALAARLPANAALLDLVRFTLYEPPATRGGKWKFTPHYEAFVLRPAAKASGYTLVWIHLGEARPLDDAAASWRQRLLGRVASTTPSEAPERTLRQLLWQRVEKHLSGCTAVVIVPDGSLTILPWAALPGRRPGSYLLEDYALSTVAYGQHLYDLLTRKPATGDRTLAVGGVRYDSVSPTAAGERLALAHRGPALDAGTRPRWGYLEGSRREAEAIAELWRPHRVDLLKNDAASEAALRQRLPGVRYVHLATHGFFADAKFRSIFRHDVAGERLFQRTRFDRRATVTGRNPLLLSGVVLAGANVPQKTNEWGAPVGDDGILTAEEVVEMDLSAAEVVVLSACETGLGKQEDEGVFGLQRAFGLAGARTTIASLWKVDDAATQQLMTRFYDNLWHKKLGANEALRQAQLTMLRGEGKEGGSRGFEVAEEDGQPVQRRLHPRLWAAWTLSGDPGDLSAVVPVVLDTEKQESAAPMAAAVVVPVWSWFVGGAALGATVGVVFLRRRRRWSA